jgi:hypothetical protein
LLRNIGAVSHEPAAIDKGAIRIHCRDVITRHSADNGFTVGNGERVWDYD